MLERHIQDVFAIQLPTIYKCKGFCTVPCILQYLDKSVQDTLGNKENQDFFDNKSEILNLKNWWYWLYLKQLPRRLTSVSDSDNKKKQVEVL